MIHLVPTLLLMSRWTLGCSNGFVRKLRVFPYIYDSPGSYAAVDEQVDSGLL
jgi:hypothetical protein